MRQKRDFWQLVAAAAIFGRKTPAEAAATADAMVLEAAQREPKWDEEERNARES